MSHKYLLFGILLALVSLLLVGCGGTDPAAIDQPPAPESQAEDVEQQPQTGAAELEPGEKLFDVSVIEVKGATDGITAPEVDPTTLSDGYRFKPPGEYDADNPEKWQVSTYMFSPAAMTVAQGDQVTLRTFVVNGDEHTIWVEAPDGSTAAAEIVMNRGRESSVIFTAEQAGYYTVHCDEHEPTMSATVLALPTG